MLQLRPNFECCDRDLPAQSTGALIWSFECTFCRECAHNTPQGHLSERWQRVIATATSSGSQTLEIPSRH
jgi:hypothetical protein